MATGNILGSSSALCTSYMRKGIGEREGRMSPIHAHTNPHTYTHTHTHVHMLKRTGVCAYTHQQRAYRALRTLALFMHTHLYSSSHTLITVTHYTHIYQPLSHTHIYIYDNNHTTNKYTHIHKQQTQHKHLLTILTIVMPSSIGIGDYRPENSRYQPLLLYK